MSYNHLHDTLRSFAESKHLTVPGFLKLKELIGILIQINNKWPSLAPFNRPELVKDHSGQFSVVWERDPDNQLILDLCYGGFLSKLKLSGEVTEELVSNPQDVIMRFVSAVG